MFVCHEFGASISRPFIVQCQFSFFCFMLEPAPLKYVRLTTRRSSTWSGDAALTRVKHTAHSSIPTGLGPQKGADVDRHMQHQPEPTLHFAWPVGRKAGLCRNANLPCAGTTRPPNRKPRSDLRVATVRARLQRLPSQLFACVSHGCRGRIRLCCVDAKRSR